MTSEELQEHADGIYTRCGGKLENLSEADHEEMRHIAANYNDNAFIINHDKTLTRAYTGKMIDLKCAAGKKAITRTPDDLRALVDDEQPYDIF